MAHVDTARSQILDLLHAVSFHKFVLNLENGDRVLIERPENIAFDPRPNSRSNHLFVITGKVRLHSTFDAVTSVVQADRNGAAAR